MSSNFGHRVATDNSYYAFTRGTEDVMRFGDDTSGQLAGFRNVLINSPFQINNGNAGTPYVSGAVLAAGDTEYLAILQDKTVLLQNELKLLLQKGTPE